MIPTVFAAVEDGISISLAPEILGHFFGVPITNTLLTVWVVMVLLIIGIFFISRNIKLIPSKFQIVLEELVGGTYKYVVDVLGNEKLARKVFPLVMTIFIFILAINWFGLIPGIESIGIYQEHNGQETFVPFLESGNTDLNITLAFALIAFFAIEIIGVSLLGFLKYGSKFVTFKSPLAFLIGIIELFSEIVRLVSFSFRLFGNMFAGKTLILVAIFFVPFILPVPLMAFELFVGFIQAFIFAILTLFFIKLATEEPH